jgi:hypothetical protein
MGFWRFFKSVEKLLKKLLHDVSLLIDSSALRDALGWLKGQLTNGARLINFAPSNSNLRCRVVSDVRRSGFFVPKMGNKTGRVLRMIFRCLDT